MSLARALSALGPRFAGTPACARAADLICAAFGELGLGVERQPFTFNGWAAAALAELSVLTPIPYTPLCATMIRSAAGCAVGRLRPLGRQLVIGVFLWERFDIVDDAGTVVGTIYQRDDGPAIPQCLEAPATVPVVVVGPDWLEPLGAVDLNEVSVSLTTHCADVPASRSENLIATRPGDPAREILICAHYDSMDGSPGANDNASGVETVLRLAALGPNLAPGTTLRFVVFSGEEWLQLGSYAYLEARREAGDLDAIKLVLNLDMIGKGEYVWASVTDETAPLVGQAMSVVLPEYRLVYHKPHMRGDHYPFHEAGLPAIMLLWWPDAAYHTGADTADRLDEETLERSARLAAHIVGALARGRG